MKSSPRMWRPTTARLLLLMVLLSLVLEAAGVTYQFKRYTYKKKRDDKKYNKLRQQCERSQCIGMSGHLGIICVRKCASPKCYEELYGHDELEEGEIDVRFNSYKGCLSQHGEPDWQGVASQHV